MKRVAVIGVLIGVAGLACYLVPRKKTEPQATPVAHDSPPPTAVKTDPIDVFQRAFWIHPTADDKILHAERREWADGDGVRKWQWFIVVEPTPSLVKRLRQDNAFGLVPTQSPLDLASAPKWFAFQSGDVEVLKASIGNMRLIFSKTGKLLYGTDFGGGFHPGAPERPPSVPSAPAANGRLPNTPPPDRKPQ